MTTSAILDSVSRITGDDRRRLARMGFSVERPRRKPSSGHVLGVECAFCGRDFALASRPSDLPEFADCPHCDTSFDYRDDEVVRVPIDDLARPAGSVRCHAA